VDAPSDAIGIGLAAAGIVIGAAIVGAIIGAVAAPPCPPAGGTSLTIPLCGPGLGAAVGGSLGLVASGVGGLGVAIFSPEWRWVGLTTTGMVGALVVINAAQQALAPKPRTSPVVASS
jgi:hypothetical protein